MFIYKVVMVGDFGVGKTSLVQRFVDNSFSEEYLSSIGVSISKKLLHTKIDSTAMLWDIEGRTEQKSIFKQYLLGAKAFIIVADLTCESSIRALPNHIKLCLSSSKDAPICIALNKNDLETNIKISIESLRKLSDNIINIYKTSAKSGEAVEDIFNEINEVLISRL
ncbi:Rab family GTPase [Sulfurimonas aquatica]|nr:Rab family GTPase [Sulfurimonas aquatica]